MPLPLPALQCAVLGVVTLTACGAPTQLPFGAACTAAADCQTGLCVQARCSKPCTGSQGCDGGLCIDKQCVAVDRVPCNGDDVCEELLPPPGPCQVVQCAQERCRLLPRANQTPCGDNKCDRPKLCTAGVCAPPAGAVTPTCDDGNPCTHDLCSPKSGCAAVSHSLACDDGKFCTTGEACVGGTCKGGKPVACGDSTSCALVLCSESAKGCTVTKPGGGPCDDGDPCTVGDTCQDGACAAGSAAACNDANPCTSDVCGAGGSCAHGLVEDGVGCQDGDACTAPDFCTAGVCSPGVLKACDDDKPCTQDKCVAGNCTFAPSGGVLPCDDGDPCTGWGVCAAEVCKKGELGAWSLVQPIVANTPHAAVAVDVRGGVVHVIGSESVGGKFEVARYQISPGAVPLGGANYGDAQWGLAAADATWMPVAETAGAHVVVGTASKPATQLAAFAVRFALDSKLPPKLTVVPDSFAQPAKSLRWRAVDVQLPHIWVAGEYGGSEPTKPHLARLNTDLTMAMQTVLDDATQGADFFEVRDIAAEPDSSGAIVVGRLTNGFKQTGYVRRVTLALQPDWQAPPAANAFWHAIVRKGGDWVVAGSQVLPNGTTAIALRSLLANGTWGWQQVHPVGIQAVAHALVVAPGGTDLYCAGWSVAEADKLATALVGRLTGFGALVDVSMVALPEKARLDALVLNEAATQVVAVGMHGPDEPNSALLVVAANAFAQVQCIDSGACTGQSATACDDGKPCTLDSCAKGKCTHLSMPEAMPCSATAVCQSGTCGSGP